MPALGGEPRLIVEGGLAPRLSPDGRRLAYSTGSFIGLAQKPQSYRSFIVDVAGGPARENYWVHQQPLPGVVAGRMLYLFSSRDGFRCLYAQRIDGGSGQPLGETTLVRHLHNVRVAGGGGASVISTGAGNAVGRQQIIFDFPDQAVNVWGMRLGPLTPPNAPAATP